MTWQILRLRDLIKRGVAVHHAGLLPIMKETVEMLFCQGYIKVRQQQQLCL
jgi:antiviral helicase SKI2